MLVSQIVSHHEDLLSQATGIETLEGTVMHFAIPSWKNSRDQAIDSLCIYDQAIDSLYIYDQAIDSLYNNMSWGP